MTTITKGITVLYYRSIEAQKHIGLGTLSDPYFKNVCVMDLNPDVAMNSTGKQKRRLRRAGRRPAKVSGPEWVN